MPEVRSQFIHRQGIRKSVIETGSKTFRALYWWGKLIGMNALTLTVNDDLKFSYVSFFYGFLLGAFSCYIFYYALVKRVTLLMPGETPIAIIVDFVGIIWQFLETSVTLFAFAARQNGAKSVVRCFATAERTSRTLGIPHDYNGSLKIFATHVMVSNILNLGIMIASETSRYYVYSYESLVWWVFNIITVIGQNMVMLFIWSLVLVNQNFRRLNEKLRLLMRNERPEGIDVVCRLHRELRNVVRSIEEYFVPLLFFTVGKSFTFITFQSYMAYSYTKGRRTLDVMDFLFLSPMCYWALNGLAALIAVSSVCGSTLRGANSTGNILHVMLNDNMNLGGTEAFAKLNILSLELLGNQVSISVLGLYKLDSFLIYSTITTAMSYLTIMLQFYN